MDHSETAAAHSWWRARQMDEEVEFHTAVLWSLASLFCSSQETVQGIRLSEGLGWHPQMCCGEGYCSRFETDHRTERGKRLLGSSGRGLKPRI